MRQRLLGLVLALGLVVGVVVLVVQQHHRSPGPAPQPTATAGSIALSGLIGSEKNDFFTADQVQQAFRAKGLTVSVRTSGSWQMAEEAKGKPYDFVIPASSVAARAITTPITTTAVRPFYSPLVVIAHQQTAQFLQSNGLATVDGNGIWTFHMAQYLADVQRQLGWSDLKGGSLPPDLAGKIYIATTDPNSSSSASLYLAVMSYLANGSQVVSDQTGIDRTAPLLHYLMANQGALLASSDQLFRDFVAGTGKPLSWTYESEVAEQAMKGNMPGDTVVLYPDIGITSDHTVVELTPKADALAQALLNDPTLINLEAQYGFRPTADPQKMVAALKTKGQDHGFLPNLTSLGSQPPPPTTDILQKIVAAASPVGSGN
ncbi:hypothetical protein [Kitasatospora kifunensis]|uniref:ABC transporter substrate-binding protein n=1 Tax=Kitasatospora kifunensis TaxID=58351 RepID=A0A7W7QZL3_KITKI|nr:hypothetical protein [Kitasatospora kifunensis]MBB4922773.1 hypothetical protein [Kitasatospora kifunensis]